MYIQRLAEEKINSLLVDNKIIILLGARQVGKTTLIEQILKKHQGVLFNLDIEIDKARLISVSKLSPDSAMKNLGVNKLLVIDEAPRLATIGQIVKGWYDAHIKIKIILLGSSSLNLLNQSAESLTGRNEKIYLPPLVFDEILSTQSWFSKTNHPSKTFNSFLPQIQSILLQHLIYGCYPEAVNTTDKEKYLLNLVSDYLLKDILQTGIVKTPDLIKRLLMLLAYQVGNEVSILELASSLSTSRQTIIRYLDLLERTFVIFRLPAYSTNLRKEISKNNKIYFWDTGVRNAIIKEFTYSNQRSDIGVLWENFVIAEANKQNLLNDNRANIYFWRTKSGSEVDLVIKGTNVFKAYEIKWSKKSAKKYNFTSKYNIPVEVITNQSFILKYQSLLK